MCSVCWWRDPVVCFRIELLLGFKAVWVSFHSSLAACPPYVESSLLLDPGHTELGKSKRWNNDSKTFLGLFLGLTAPLRSWYPKTTEYNAQIHLFNLGCSQTLLSPIKGGLEPLGLGKKLRRAWQLTATSSIANRCCLLHLLCPTPKFKKFSK